MPKATPTELVGSAQNFADDHDCGYAQQVLTSPKSPCQVSLFFRARGGITPSTADRAR